MGKQKHQDAATKAIPGKQLELRRACQTGDVKKVPTHPSHATCVFNTVQAIFSLDGACTEIKAFLIHRLYRVLVLSCTSCCVQSCADAGLHLSGTWTQHPGCCIVLVQHHNSLPLGS